MKKMKLQLQELLKVIQTHHHAQMKKLLLHSAARQEEAKEQPVAAKNKSTQTIVFAYVMKDNGGDPAEVDERQVAKDAREAFKKAKKGKETEKQEKQIKVLEDQRFVSPLTPFGEEQKKVSQWRPSLPKDLQHSFWHLCRRGPQV